MLTSTALVKSAPTKLAWGARTSAMRAPLILALSNVESINTHFWKSTPSAFTPVIKQRSRVAPCSLTWRRSAPVKSA